MLKDKLIDQQLVKLHPSPVTYYSTANIRPISGSALASDHAMNFQRNTLSVRIAALSSILGFCGLLGCSKATPPVPALSVKVATVGTNAVGEVLVQLSLTNRSARGMVVSVRSAIYAAQGTWTTNFNIHPLFVGLAGPGSQASNVSLVAGQGITVALAPVRVPGPFQIELVCFPSRAGIAGTVDKAKDKIEEFKDGSQHESYLGGSFYVVSPLIDPRPTRRFTEWRARHASG